MRRCSIYWHAVRLDGDKADKITPRGWEHNARGAQELWVQRAIRTHPWRVDELEAADVVIVAANFTLLQPPSGRRYDYAAFAQWSKLLREAPPQLLRAILSINNGSSSSSSSSASGFLPRVATFLEPSAPVPWRLSPAKPAKLLRIRDHAMRATDIVAPPVHIAMDLRFARSAAATAAGGGMKTSWRERPLLLFAGHTPKLQISRLRFELLRQLWHASDVTAISTTINCTVLPYEVCTSAAEISRSYAHFCHHGCAPRSYHMFARARAASAGRGGRGATMLLLPGRRPATFAKWLPPLPRCTGSAAELRRVCSLGRYAEVKYAYERRAMGAAAVALGDEEYAKQAMKHRFCLAAPGDTPATPKFVEYVLAAAHGGCIPVFVLPDCLRCNRAMHSPLNSPQSARSVERRWRALALPVEGSQKGGGACSRAPGMAPGAAVVTDGAGDRCHERNATSATEAPTSSTGVPDSCTDFSAAHLASLETHAAHLLPYSQTGRIDYCAMAFILPESRASDIAAVLQLLRKVTSEQAEAKRAKCASAAHALRYRADDVDPTASRPAAVAHLLEEICMRVHHERMSELTPPMLDRRCLLLPQRHMSRPHAVV